MRYEEILSTTIDNTDVNSLIRDYMYFQGYHQSLKAFDKAIKKEQKSKNNEQLDELMEMPVMKERSGELSCSLRF